MNIQEKIATWLQIRMVLKSDKHYYEIMNKTACSLDSLASYKMTDKVANCSISTQQKWHLELVSLPQELWDL